MPFVRVCRPPPQPETLRRYCAVYGLHVRPDCTPYELGVSAGRCVGPQLA